MQENEKFVRYRRASLGGWIGIVRDIDDIFWNADGQGKDAVFQPVKPIRFPGSSWDDTAWPKESTYPRKAMLPKGKSMIKFLLTHADIEDLCWKKGTPRNVPRNVYQYAEQHLHLCSQLERRAWEKYGGPHGFKGAKISEEEKSRQKRKAEKAAKSRMPAATPSKNAPTPRLQTLSCRKEESLSPTPSPTLQHRESPSKALRALHITFPRPPSTPTRKPKHVSLSQSDVMNASDSELDFSNIPLRPTSPASTPRSRRRSAKKPPMDKFKFFDDVSHDDDYDSDHTMSALSPRKSMSISRKKKTRKTLVTADPEELDFPENTAEASKAGPQKDTIDLTMTSDSDTHYPSRPRTPKSASLPSKSRKRAQTFGDDDDDDDDDDDNDSDGATIFSSSPQKLMSASPQKRRKVSIAPQPSNIIEISDR